MPLVSIDLPPGFYANGTEYEAQGRWRDGNLVRWQDGSLRPVGGWQGRPNNAVTSTSSLALEGGGSLLLEGGTDSLILEGAAFFPMFDNPARALLAWESNNGNRWIAGGSADELMVANASSQLYDITPTGLVAGNVDAQINTGYGGGFYGLGFYGVPRPPSDDFTPASTWSLDAWGQNLVACCDADGKLYEWDLDVTGVAETITNAPTNCLGLLVTEERFLFALGAGGNPRRIEWSDQEDNTTWTPAATNQAGGQTLQTFGQIMAGIRTLGQALIVTDIDAHRAQYVGPPFVYQFERIGTSCGLAARKAITATDAGVFWMGRNGFFFYDGSSVRELACDVHDRVFDDINRSQISKAWAVPNGQFGEVWFFYPSSRSQEPDSYVAFDYLRGHWLVGRLTRTAGIDRGVFRDPIYVTADGNLNDHETGLNHDGAEVYAQSGPAQIGVGDRIMNVHRLIPDEKTQGDVTVTFSTRLYPNAPESTFGPYVMENPTSVRFSGRQATIRVNGARKAAWRFGTPRVEVTEGGRR